MDIELFRSLFNNIAIRKVLFNEVSKIHLHLIREYHIESIRKDPRKSRGKPTFISKLSPPSDIDQVKKFKDVTITWCVAVNELELLKDYLKHIGSREKAAKLVSKYFQQCLDNETKELNTPQGQMGGVGSFGYASNQKASESSIKSESLGTLLTNIDMFLYVIDWVLVYTREYNGVVKRFLKDNNGDGKIKYFDRFILKYALTVSGDCELVKILFQDTNRFVLTTNYLSQLVYGRTIYTNNNNNNVNNQKDSNNNDNRKKVFNVFIDMLVKHNLNLLIEDQNYNLLNSSIEHGSLQTIEILESYHPYDFEDPQVNPYLVTGLEVIQYLEGKVRSLNPSMYQMENLVRCGDLDSLKYLISKYPNIIWRGATITDALSSGRLDVVYYLTSIGKLTITRNIPLQKVDLAFIIHIVGLMESGSAPQVEYTGFGLTNTLPKSGVANTFIESQQLIKEIIDHYGFATSVPSLCTIFGITEPCYHQFLWHLSVAFGWIDCLEVLSTTYPDSYTNFVLKAALEFNQINSIKFLLSKGLFSMQALEKEKKDLLEDQKKPHIFAFTSSSSNRNNMDQAWSLAVNTTLTESYLYLIKERVLTVENLYNGAIENYHLYLLESIHKHYPLGVGNNDAIYSGGLYKDALYTIYELQVKQSITVEQVAGKITMLNNFSQIGLLCRMISTYTLSVEQTQQLLFSILLDAPTGLKSFIQNSIRNGNKKVSDFANMSHIAGFTRATMSLIHTMVEVGSSVDVIELIIDGYLENIVANQTPPKLFDELMKTYSTSIKLNNDSGQDLLYYMTKLLWNRVFQYPEFRANHYESLCANYKNTIAKAYTHCSLFSVKLKKLILKRINDLNIPLSN